MCEGHPGLGVYDDAVGDGQTWHCDRGVGVEVSQPGQGCHGEVARGHVAAANGPILQWPCKRMVILRENKKNKIAKSPIDRKYGNRFLDRSKWCKGAEDLCHLPT